MQVLRWIGSVMWNKPVSGYKQGRTLKPEALFSLPGDRKKEDIPLVTKEQFDRAVKKVEQSGWLVKKQAT